ncbi:MAG TPA: replicative DNA helicase [Tissierellales bacterium]|nr:replicative DNA helicase [Tissierellales bacterium]
MLQNEKVEQAVLACMLIDRDCAIDSGLVAKDDFTNPINKEIFLGIRQLVKQEKQVDYMTVYQNLNQKVDLTYLMQLSNVMPSILGFKQYTEDLKDLTLKRKLYKLGDELKNRDKKGKEIAELAEKEIFKLQEGMTTGEITQVKDVVLDTVMNIQEIHDGKKEAGLKTGYKAIDNLLDGYKKGDLIILAARPAMGKTALALNIAEKLTKDPRENKSVMFFSLEMSDEELTQRLIFSSSMVDSDKLRKKSLDKHDWERISDMTSLMLQTKLFIDDNPARTVSEMQSIGRRVKRKYGLDLIIVDYLQLMTTNDKRENRQQEISSISRGLKIMAKELDVPVIALSQLSRACELRNDKRPMLSDLRESGAIEQDADVVKFIYRDEYYNADTDEPGIAEIIIAKNRKGPTGIARLGWIANCTKFVDITDLETRY